MLRPLRALLRVAALGVCLAMLPGPVPGRAAVAGKEPKFVTLCYHNILPAPSALAPAATISITLEELTGHFDWLRDNGYTAVSVEDILRASKGGKELPPKAVLLSFDDGYASFYHLVYPLLRAYQYPAMLALETTWLETPADKPVDYGGTAQLPRSYFMTWSQIREMAESGLVELAGHTHNLHQGHSSNPHGVPQPAAATLAYDPARGAYESARDFYLRVKKDVTRNAEIIAKRTGRRPRVLVWPYGWYKGPGVRAALDAGYSLTASMGLKDDWPTFSRYMAYPKMNFDDVMNKLAAGDYLRTPPSRLSGGLWGKEAIDAGYSRYRDGDALRDRYPVQRVMQVDLDMVCDPDPQQQYKNISALFDRIKALSPSAVYLQAFADPDGDGIADALYFPNRHLPMRADLFNYVSWQIFSRLGVRVYAWMPVLGFKLPGDHPLVRADLPDKTGSSYQRLSPFDPGNRKIIAEIYTDLAMHSNVLGLLFHDDALLGDYEDASPAGLAWLRGQGLPESVGAIRRDPDLMRRFTRAKSLALVDFTKDLQASFRTWSPVIKTARNIYAQAVLNPDAEEWFAQRVEDFLDSYDYTVIMAMPFMEGAKNPMAWLEKMARKIQSYPMGAEKTVFELQAVDWRPGGAVPVPSKTLARQMNLLQQNGIGNIGYYPEDPIAEHPDISVIRPFFSTQENPFLR